MQDRQMSNICSDRPNEGSEATTGPGPGDTDGVNPHAFNGARIAAIR